MRPCCPHEGRGTFAEVLDLRILGPLEVREDGDAIHLGGTKQRGLLAILVLRANEVVSTDRLIDGLGARRLPTTRGWRFRRTSRACGRHFPVVTRSR